MEQRRAAAPRSAHLDPHASSLPPARSEDAELARCLHAAAEGVARALTSADVVEAAAAQALAALGARASGAYRLADTGKHLEVIYATEHSEEPITEGVRLQLHEGLPAGQVLLTGEPLWLESPAQIERYPLVREVLAVQGVQAIALLPLKGGDRRPFGVFRVSFAEPHRWPEAEREFITALAELCAPALERAARFEHESAARITAEANNRARDEFLAVLSHELRTPLTPIFGFAALLRRRLASTDPVVEEALAAIERGARQELRLVNDLLDISRVISGKLVLIQEPVNPRVVIEAALADIRLEAEVKGVQVTVALANTGPVLGDQERLRQVVGNLLINAIKFTPSGGRVHIRLEQRDGEVILTVADTGIGIAPDYLPSVFERFSQADPTSSRRHHGLGLGLAIVRHLVEGHGGHVSAASDGIDRGATFTITLPCILSGPDADSRSVHPSGPPPATAERLSGARILLVEDHEPTRQSLALLMGDEGATVLAAASAGEAESWLVATSVDLLIIDIGLPDEDGYSLLRRLRTGGSPLAAAPALALTAYAGASARADALRAGFTEHLAKPPDTDLLLTTLMRLLGR